jgi:hypothetical protein
MWIGCSAFAGNVKVVATVDRNNLNEGDSFIYSISITSEGSMNLDREPTLPKFEGFDLITANSSTEARSGFINGKFLVEQTRTFDYQMAAPRKGVFRIGSAKVVIDGKEFLTNQITVTVNAGAGGGGIPPQARRRQRTVDPGDDIDEMENMFNQLMQRHMRPGGGGVGGGGQQQAEVNPNDAFFIQAETDKTKVYAGEQITGSWYLYTRGQIADIDTLKYPELKGFWKEEIEMATRLNFQQEVINGVVYQKALLVSYALFPIKAGKALIDPYRAKCTVVVGGPFGFGKSYPFTKASKEITVDVLEVPTLGRPPEFTGAVGHFTVSATLDPQTQSANQPVTMKIKFSGRGNAKLIDLPPINLPPGIELYSQKADAKFFKDGTSYKEFEVLLIPRETGNFEIPALKSAFLNPQTGKFDSISSQKMSLTVTPGKPGDNPTLPSLAKNDEPLKAEEAFLPPPMLLDEAHVWVAGPVRQGFWAIIFTGLLSWLAGRFYFVYLRKPKRETLQMALKKRMRAVQSAIDTGDWRKAGVELTNSIYLILGQITEQGGANLQFEKLMDAASPSLRRELAGPIKALLDKAEQLGFAPEDGVGTLKEKSKMMDLRKEAETVLSKAIILSERG